jgi:class III poly(R)-hydroxyalkanoic acid synthase PhaE subunit
MLGTAMLPFQQMQQAWLDLGRQLGGTSMQSYTAAFDRMYGALSDALGFGPMRKLQAAAQELTAAAAAQNDARARYAILVQSAFTAGVEKLLQRLADMAQRGERIDSVLALMRLWAVCTEQAVHDVLQSPKGLEATAAAMRAEFTYRQKLQQVSAIIADALDMATRRDLDEAYREIQALKRELRARPTPHAATALLTKAPARRRKGKPA